MIGYGLGYMGRKVVSKKYERRLNALLKLFGRFGMVAVFIFALTPLPDDFIFIPFGLLHYNFLKVFIPAVSGKFLMCLIIAHAGEAAGQIYAESPIFAPLTIALLVLFMIALFRIDWEKIGKIKIKKRKKKPLVKENRGRFIELAVALGAYAAINYLAFKTPMKVEWVWRILQFSIPIATIFVLGRSLKNIGLTSKNMLRGIELGILTGILLAIGLAPLYLIWMPLIMPQTLTPFRLGYAIIFITTNVMVIEIFYRGYLQTRFEAVIGGIQALIITSVLCGLDFLEYSIFHPAMIVIAALVFGFIYQRTRTLATPIAAHTTYLLLVMIISTF